MQSTAGGSLRIIAYECRDGKDMYQVEYPGGRGVRWVHSFMIGGSYSDEKNAVKFRHEQRLEHDRRHKQQASIAESAGSMEVDNADSASVPIVSSMSSRSVESLKCVCQQLYPGPSEDLITCSSCGRKSHVKCMRAEGLQGGEATSWQCVFCRIMQMDPFSPGFELLAFASTPRNMNLPASVDGSLTMRFNVEAAQLREWQMRRVALSVRCVAIGAKGLRLPQGPLWPKEVTASVNAFRDVFKITPAKYGHVRREPMAKGIEDMVRPSANSVALHYHAPVEGLGGQLGAPRFLFAVVAAEARSKIQLLQGMRKPAESESRERALGILRSAVLRAAQIDSDELRVETSLDADVMRSRCPLSLCEIETAVRGEDCEHLQCFDADAYVDVNMRLRNVEKRWRCPICAKVVRPEDLAVDAWVGEAIVAGRKESGRDSIRLRLGSVGNWEVLPEEDAQGEGSEDEDDVGPAIKRPRQENDDQVLEIE